MQQITAEQLHLVNSAEVYVLPGTAVCSRGEGDVGFFFTKTLAQLGEHEISIVAVAHLYELNPFLTIKSN